MSAKLIEELYSAFDRRDAAAMGRCYADDARFWDPVFLDLSADRARAMWSMLCESGTDLAIELSDVRVDGDTGSAHWDARYTFSGTGRKVLNRIDASFRFRDGKIVEHRDSFSLWRWSSMALGPAGVLLGWTPLVQGKIRSTARKALDAYIAKR